MHPCLSNSLWGWLTPFFLPSSVEQNPAELDYSHLCKSMKAQIKTMNARSAGGNTKPLPPVPTCDSVWLSAHHLWWLERWSDRLAGNFPSLSAILSNTETCTILKNPGSLWSPAHAGFLSRGCLVSCTGLEPPISGCSTVFREPSMHGRGPRSTPYDCGIASCSFCYPSSATALPAWENAADLKQDTADNRNRVSQGDTHWI